MQTFLSGINTLEEAKLKFDKFGITPPDDDSIKYHLYKPYESQEEYVLLKVESGVKPSDDLNDTEYLTKNLFNSIKVPEKYLTNTVEQDTNQKKKKK